MLHFPLIYCFIMLTTDYWFTLLFCSNLLFLFCVFFILILLLHILLQGGRVCLPVSSFISSGKFVYKIQNSYVLKRTNRTIINTKVSKRKENCNIMIIYLKKQSFNKRGSQWRGAPLNGSFSKSNLFCKL